MDVFRVTSKATRPVSVCLGYKDLEKKAANFKGLPAKPKVPYSVRIDAEDIQEIKQAIKRLLATKDAKSDWGQERHVYQFMKRSAPNKDGRIWDKTTVVKARDYTNPFHWGYVKQKGGTAEVADLLAFSRPSIVYDSDSRPVPSHERVTEKSIIKAVARPKIIRDNSRGSTGWKVVLELIQIRVIKLEDSEEQERLTLKLPEPGTKERAAIDNSWDHGHKKD